jgi:hypothetical protein
VTRGKEFEACGGGKRQGVAVMVPGHSKNLPAGVPVAPSGEGGDGFAAGGGVEKVSQHDEAAAAVPGQEVVQPVQGVIERPMGNPPSVGPEGGVLAKMGVGHKQGVPPDQGAAG